MEKTAKRVLKRLEEFQTRQPLVGFPVAVYRKFGEDQAGNYAALITYYGFLSLFPLLLIFVSVLNLLFSSSGLKSHLVRLALANFPLLGGQLQPSLHASNSVTAGVIVGLVVTFFGARGFANVIQEAMNQLWRVPIVHRPGFPHSFLRSLSIMITLGVGLILSTWLVGFGHWYGIGLSVLANVALFLSVFRLATAGGVGTRQLVSGAIIAAVFWELLQVFGTFLVAHELRQLNGIYGAFAIVLGLLWWIYLQAEVTLWAVEIDVVRALKLWPRSLIEPPLMEEDKQAYTRYAKTEQRRPEQEVDVKFKDPQ